MVRELYAVGSLPRSACSLRGVFDRVLRCWVSVFGLDGEWRR